MVATDPAGRQQPRVAVALRSGGNAGLVRELLAEWSCVEGRIELQDDGQPAFDLAIVDGGGLADSRGMLEHCRSAASPVTLPVLLIVDSRGGSAAAARGELGQTVDDILRIPATREELGARIGNLLRLRALSRDQHARFEQATAALEGANRALHTLHAGNEVLVRARDERTLLTEVCRVIVEQERYKLAWAGFVREADDPEIVIDAVAGDASGYVEDIRLLHSQMSGGPAWRAVEHGEVEVGADLQADTRVESIWSVIREYGLHSTITLPLLPASGAPGVLAIYSEATGDFRDEERDVLARLAANIEYGLNALRAERERDRQREAIRSLAYSDALTGLPNRNFLVERLNTLLADEQVEHNVAVLFIDLDHFKIINDALGHEAGDTVLRQVAQRLQQIVRTEDFVARQGGDEFIVVMTEPPRSEEWREAASGEGGFAAAARALGQRLAERLREPLIVEGYERRLGASVGISLYPEHGRGAAELIDCADTAMYAAKNEDGRVRLYSEVISRRRQHRLSMEGRLYNALDAGEFRLHYQPVFDLASGTIEGVEALIRWPQPDGSSISPGQFMPVAEETGLIVPLGEWVLRTAVAQRAAWLRQGHDLLMAVNVSVRQLKQQDAAEGLLAAIGNAVDPTRIELEVTESDLMDETGHITETLERLHAGGFRLAVDDFGTGYSSLSRLQEMPITTLKIDKSFVARLGEDSRGSVIARSVQHLADGLGVRCLAEGVETDLQRRSLLDLGCRVGQGFWLSGALPPDELLARVRAQSETEAAPGQRT